MFPEQYKRVLLLTELVGIIHDIGKVSGDLIKNEDVKVRPYVNHLLIPFLELGGDLKLLQDDVDGPGRYSQYSNNKNKINAKSSLFDSNEICKNIHNLNLAFKKKTLDEIFGDELAPEIKAIFAPDQEGASLDDVLFNSLVVRHHMSDRYKKLFQPNSIFTRILGLCDNFDSREERISSRKKVKTLLVSSVFGKDLEELEEPLEVRIAKYEEMGKALNQNRDKIYQELELILKEIADPKMYIEDIHTHILSLKRYLNSAASMTVLADNDSTVWDHGYMTGTIAKVLISSLLLKMQHEDITSIINLNKLFADQKAGRIYWILSKQTFDLDVLVERGYTVYQDISIQNMVYKGDQEGYKYFTICKINKDHPKKWQFRSRKGDNIKIVNVKESHFTKLLLECFSGIPQILGIQFPGREFLTQVYRMPDFIGRDHELRRIRKQIKSLVETKYSLGNQIYEDVNGLYYLVPDIQAYADLKDEIEKEIHQIFNKGTDGGKGFLIPSISLQPAAFDGKYLNFGHGLIKLKKSYETNFKRKLSGVKLRQLALPDWCQEWKSKRSREVCQVCQRMPVERHEIGRYQGDKLCSWCKERRQEGLAKYGSYSTNRLARFIDQVMDEEHQVVLLTGELGLLDLWLQGDYIRTTRLYIKTRSFGIFKKASPSRLRRVYEEVVEFQNEVESLLSNYSQLQGQSVQFQLDGTNISEGFWEHKFKRERLIPILKKQLLKYLSSEDHDIDLIATNLYEKLSFKDQKAYGIYVYQTPKGLIAEGIIGYSNDEIVKNVYLSLILPEVFREYFKAQLNYRSDSGQSKKASLLVQKEVTLSKVRKVYGIADEFMYLLPANKVLMVTNEIHKLFERRFGRVKGRLSLNLGMVFADHKYPLYLVLDAGKRMLKEFREAVVRGSDQQNGKITEGLEATFTRNKQSNGELEGIIRFKDSLMKNETIKYINTEKILNVADENIQVDDYYSGLLEVGKQVVAPTDLQKRDEVEIVYAPNLVDYEYLNSVRNRILLAIERGEEGWKKRPHLVWPYRLRPYTRDQFNEFELLNAELNQHQVSSTALKNLEAGLIEHIQKLCLSENDYLKNRGTIREIGLSLLMNISSLKQFYQELDLDRREKWLDIIEDGRIFDLMEMRTFLRILPTK